MSDTDLTTFISLSPHDFPDVVDCDGSCRLAGRGGAPYACLLHAGLCWPEDALTVVIMGNDDDPDDCEVVDNPDVCADDPDVYTGELLEDLRVAASLLPPAGRHGLQQTTGRGEGLLFGPERESAPPDMDDAAVMRGGGRAGVCSDGAPRLPAAAVHAVLSDRSCTTTTSSSLETESSPPPATTRPVVPMNKPETKLPPRPPPVSRLVVPRKKRDRSVKRGLWSLDITSIITTCGGGSHGKDGDDSRRNANAHVRRRLLGVGARPPRSRQITQSQRRACSHCDSMQTPQWRAGPDGPGTLCNACGIRYTMNKLLPEYRPSTSPSFRSDKHSNRHRKGVRLREKRVQEKVVNMPAATEHGELLDVCKYTAEEEGKREDCQQNEAEARPW